MGFGALGFKAQDFRSSGAGSAQTSFWALWWCRGLERPSTPVPARPEGGVSGKVSFRLEVVEEIRKILYVSYLWPAITWNSVCINFDLGVIGMLIFHGHLHKVPFSDSSNNLTTDSCV